MSQAFRVVAAFNAVTAVWLTAMFLILRHAAFARNAAVSLGVAVFCAAAIRSTGAAGSPAARQAAVVGSLLMGLFGAWVVYEEARPDAVDIEGYLLIIGAAWVAQGALALAVPARRTARL